MDFIWFNHFLRNKNDVDDVEHLAKDVRIIGETFTECTTEYAETKWNIACYGRMIWVDKVAIIVTDKD